MRNRFEMQLDAMNKKLTQMGELCVKAIANATSALEQGDQELARLVIQEDNEIDEMEKEIERSCLKLLLQQQPVARDLRQISAALKMITDMERIGDQTSDISEIILSADMREKIELKYIGKMAEKVSGMVHDSIVAFVEKDLVLTQEVITTDDIVDEMFDDIRKELIDWITTKPSQGELAIDLMMVTKYLERIGDHATNIAEWVEFSITGIHQGRKED